MLVNNAGILKFNSIADTPIEELRHWCINVNLVGVLHRDEAQ